MIHGYGSKADQPWINMDQRGSVAFSMSPSAFSLQPSACRRRHGSCVMRPASDSWLMRHASGVRRHVSGVMCPASCVMRQTPRPSFSTFSRRPLPVMTTTERRHFPTLPPSDLRPLSCMAWGNRVVLPTPYSSTGTNRNSGRRSKEHRPLFLLIRKRPA